MADLETSTGVRNPMVLLNAMVEKGVDPAALKQMMDLAERWEANQAKAAYSVAMTEAQAEMPVVVRATDNKRTNKMYAALETINSVCKPVYTRHGFSLSFGEAESPLPDHTRVIVDVRHRAGHVERYQGDYPVDGRGAKGGEVMNAIQGHVSTNTYAIKDMIRKVFNITIADADVDGENGGATLLPAEVLLINTAIEEAQAVGKLRDVKGFFKWIGTKTGRVIESLEDVPRSAFLTILQECGAQKAKAKVKVQA